MSRQQVGAPRARRRGSIRGAAAMVMVAGMGIGLPGSAAADSAGATLRYTCAVPGLPNQPMTAQVAWNAPASVTAGQTAPAMAVTAPAAIGPTVTWALGITGAATVEGSVDAPMTVVAPGENIPVATRLAVPRTVVPGSGPLTVRATGTTPGLVFHRPGHATITVDNDLVLHFTPRNASGNPTVTGEVDFSCTEDPGQSAVVYSFDITPPAAPPAPDTTGPVVSPTVAAPRTSTTSPSPTSVTATSTTMSLTVTTTTASAAAGTTGERLDAASVGFEGVVGRGMGWWLTAAGLLAAVTAVVGGVWWRTRRRRMTGR